MARKGQGHGSDHEEETIAYEREEHGVDLFWEQFLSYKRTILLLLQAVSYLGTIVLLGSQKERGLEAGEIRHGVEEAERGRQL
jgi:hypothetical protein